MFLGYYAVAWYCSMPAYYMIRDVTFAFFFCILTYLLRLIDACIFAPQTNVLHVLEFRNYLLTFFLPPPLELLARIVNSFLLSVFCCLRYRMLVSRRPR